MKPALTLLLLPATATPFALAQAATTTATATSNTMPTADFGFNLPSRLGTFNYSLTASELLETGYGNGVSASTVGSGNLAYLSRSEHDPFSLVYSGGFIHSNAPGYPANSTFQNLAFSQVVRTRSWVYVLSDAVSYLPQSPTTGLSGIAGVGDVGIPPVQTGISPGQTILTDYGRRVGNGLQGSANWQITSSTTLEGSASWETLRFLGTNNPGLNTNQYLGSVGPSYRINALSSFAVNAVYSEQTYPSYNHASIESEGVNFIYNRTWSRRVTTSISAGPERSHGEGFGTFEPQTSLAASASITYAGRNTGYYASYSRGVNAGSGVIPGALTDTITAGMNRPFGRSWNLGLDGAYSRNISLFETDNFQIRVNSIYGGIQLSRRLTESLSCYGSYTAIDQSGNDLASAANAFSGNNQTVAFGITFAPQSFHSVQ